MSDFKLSDLIVNEESDWVPVVLPQKYITLGEELGVLQEEQSKARGLRDRSIDKDPEKSLIRSIRSKQAELAVKWWAGDIARVTQPGEFHDYPDVGQCNVRFIFDKADGLMIQKNDQGELVKILTTVKDQSFSDKTIWLIGWGITDLMRRHFLMINQFRPNPNWGLMGTSFQPHEQFIYPRSMLNPMRTLSKEWVNTPYILKVKE